MAHIGDSGAMPDLWPLIVEMARCGEGRPAAEVAQAALSLALGLWATDDEVTREMVMTVVTSQIEARFRSRSN